MNNPNYDTTVRTCLWGDQDHGVEVTPRLNKRPRLKAQTRVGCGRATGTNEVQVTYTDRETLERDAKRLKDLLAKWDQAVAFIEQDGVEGNFAGAGR